MVQGKKVLVVDDDTEILDTISTALELIGCEIRTASTAKDAWGKLTGWVPDLVLLDVMLPDTDGISFCRTLHNNIDTQTTPVIMLTGLSDGETYHDAFLFGATDFIVKPFEINVLQDKVTKTLLSAVKGKHVTPH